MISSFGAILAWKSDNAADADDDYDDDRKSDPYMSPSYAGDTTSVPRGTLKYAFHSVMVQDIVMLWKLDTREDFKKLIRHFMATSMYEV